MASNTTKEKTDKTPIFPVGPAGKRELRRALVRSTDPAATIQTFQETHSLHAMMARAFGTQTILEQKSNPQHRARRSQTQQQMEQQEAPPVAAVESLDSDSVMTFLSHLGVSQHEVHKRISDTLLKQLEEEIRKTTATEPLLSLLSACWAYATTIPELRPLVWTVLKQLGARTPLAVLLALAERNASGELKHTEIFRPLPPLLKRLCWEADWDRLVPLEEQFHDVEPKAYLAQVGETLFYQTVQPFLDDYTNHAQLKEAANRAFVSTTRERRLLTTQRRALTSTTTTSTSTARSAPTTGSLFRASGGQTNTNASNNNTNSTTEASTRTTGRAIAQLRSLLCHSVGTTSSYRPKLLYALLSTLIAQHGQLKSVSLGGSQHLHGTLVADLLLSSGGPLPKPYQHVVTLARMLDQAVQEGNLSDATLKQVQDVLKKIFQPDGAASAPATPSTTPSKKEPEPTKKTSTTSPTPAVTNALQRQLNRIATAGLNAMKEVDPQNLFLNPVTDAIAPGYSSVISHPMCISTMEEKIDKSAYKTLQEWQADVKLIFKNCIDYNRGKAGQWFRGEAQRQQKVFREEIYPQAKKLYDAEVAKRNAPAVVEQASSLVTPGKRKEAPTGPTLEPLLPSTKKRKKEGDYLPSMQALAAMLLRDPFVVRLLVARGLRELRLVVGGASVPAAHNVVVCVLQLLFLARESVSLCATRGKRFSVPPSGLIAPNDDSDNVMPYTVLRKHVPLLLRLVLEAELDKRVAVGGDLQATAALAERPEPVGAWQVDSGDSAVSMALLQGSLIHLCQPGHGNEASLAVTFAKFASAIQSLSSSAMLWEDVVFFESLIQALLRHKSKLAKTTRDAVVEAWLSWLKGTSKKKQGSVTAPVHECLIRLLNEWSSLGNLLLPRDTLVQLATDAVHAANASEKKEDRQFAVLYQQNALHGVQLEYERMLKQLPDERAEQWKESVGIAPEEKAQDGMGEQEGVIEDVVEQAADEDKQVEGTEPMEE